MLYEKGNFYHLYNRGCNKENIFSRETDYNDLIRRIKSSNHREYVNILAFCLMPNHFHFLVQQKTDKAVTDWIGFIFNGYVQFFNREYNRTGTLFESSVKSKLIINNNYLIKSIIYIHLNPVIAGLVSSPEDWKFSNYSDWIGNTNSALTNYEYINENFNYKEEYKAMVLKALEDKKLQEEVEKDFE